MRGAAVSVPAIDPRRIGDRRRTPTPMFSRFTLAGRRAGARRRVEERGAFVDLYSRALFAALMLVAAFNLVDAYCTLFFLGEGATEMNPVADFLLRQGAWLFVLGKSLGIGICLGFLCLTKNFYMSRAGLTLVFGAYFLLTGYHIYLMGTQLGPV